MTYAHALKSLKKIILQEHTPESPCEKCLEALEYINKLIEFCKNTSIDTLIISQIPKPYPLTDGE